MQRAETDKCLTHSEYWAGLYRLYVNYRDHMGQDKDGKQEPEGEQLCII